MIYNDQRIKILDINKKSKEAGAIRFDKGSASPTIISKLDQKDLEFLNKTLTGNINGYPPEEGIKELVELIQSIENNVNDIKVTKDEICLSNGALHSLTLVLGTLFSKGDSVIVNYLSFEGFSTILEMLGIIPVRVDLQNKDELKKAIEENHPKAIIINSPENPSGVIYKEDLLEELNSLAHENNLFIISDEVNNQNIFTPFHFISPSKFITPDKLIIVNSFSKNYFLTSIRLGWIIADAKIIRKIKNILSVSQVSIGIPQQAIACLVISKYQKKIDNFRKELYRKKILGEKVLKELGLNYLNPVQGGSAYIVEIGVDSGKFCEYLLDQYNIGVVPGTYFGEEWRNWIRIGFGAVTENELKENLPKIKQALSNL